MVAQEWVYFSSRMGFSLTTYIFSRSNIFIESTASKEVNSSFTTVEVLLHSPVQQSLYKRHLSSRTEDPSFLTKHYLVAPGSISDCSEQPSFSTFFSDLVFHFSKSAADSPPDSFPALSATSCSTPALASCSKVFQPSCFCPSKLMFPVTF